LLHASVVQGAPCRDAPLSSSSKKLTPSGGRKGFARDNHQLAKRLSRPRRSDVALPLKAPVSGRTALRDDAWHLRRARLPRERTAPVRLLDAMRSEHREMPARPEPRRGHATTRKFVLVMLGLPLR